MSEPDKPDVLSTSSITEDVQLFHEMDTASADEGFVPRRPVSESPPPMIEKRLPSQAGPYRHTKYTFEKLIPGEDVMAGTDVADAKHQPYTGDTPMSVVMVLEARVPSSESGTVATVSSECLTQSADVESQSVKVRSSSPDSLPEYRPMSLESAMEWADRRASSPGSSPQLDENRSLSPDSPVPQFTASLEDYAATQLSSSAGSLSSDSECELVVTSAFAQTDRPSSPESLSSVSQLRQLPDSPVPDFMRILSSYFMNATCSDRSSSPVSLSPDAEFVALPIECWIDDSPRPLSPRSVDSMEELGLAFPRTDEFVSESDPSGHLTSFLPNKRLPLRIEASDTGAYTRDGSLEPSDTTEWPKPQTIKSEFLLDPGEGLQPESETGSISLEEFQKDLSRTASTDRGPGQTPEGKLCQLDDTVQWKLSSATQDSSQIKAFVEDKLVPLQLPNQSSYTTHRTVTPVLPETEMTSGPPSGSEWASSSNKGQSCELFSPMSTQFLVPPDYEAIFSGHQTLRVSDTHRPVDDPVLAQILTEAPIQDDSPTSEDLSPEFSRVLSKSEELAPDSESEDVAKDLGKKADSPGHSDSDLEFFDCRQVFSDSDPEDVKLQHDAYYRISEPPSPLPGSTPDDGVLKRSRQYGTHLRVDDYKRFSSGSESLGEFAYDSEGLREFQTQGDPPEYEELPSRDHAGYCDDDDDFLGREIAEELGALSSDSSEEEVLTTRVVRRRVIIQADNLPDLPPQTVTEEKYTDEHGNMVVKKITRKVIHKYVSADGTQTQEVSMEGSQQEPVPIQEGDSVSRVIKRTVLRSEGDQKELTFSQPRVLEAATSSHFEVEPVQGRKVSKVVKTTVIRGERVEKQTGDSSLAADLPSAREDFEKALSYAGGFGKALVPRVVEKEIVQDDGSVVKRSQMCKSRTQKRTVVRDILGKHVHLESLDDTPEALQPDALQQHLHRLLQRYCEEDQEEEEEEEEEERE
ncbi:Ankyrin-2 [Takifugu flavidus]|uniref:Ankyrin-2 n=1 Tax=Takifugu flavidus TaxID=433684 RepID=A0A5C6N9E6_9TELE|nr:Ankyrin-2 [Takifugu flavidus]